jgi:hypothetical protein
LRPAISVESRLVLVRVRWRAQLPLDRAVGRDPSHHFRVRKVPTLAADFSDTFVRFRPCPGEVVEALHLARRHGLDPHDGAWRVQLAIIDFVARHRADQPLTPGFRLADVAANSRA